MTKNIIKVNLGSGKNCIDGWICIDNSPKTLLAKLPTLKWILYKCNIISEKDYNEEWNKNIIYRNLLKKLPFENNSIDYVYSSHLLEHFSREDALNICKDVFRILKEDGIFRVVVPDLKIAAVNYINNNISFFSECKTKPTADQLLDYLMLHTFHKWYYDSESLQKLLCDSGFKKVYIAAYQWGRIPIPDLKILETHKKRSIYVETMK